ncbi:carboxypeptidase-like regulatory domain-containing protein [Aureisphaera sp. CAU 1614]|uniref:Carboxypeptidase-like regulatory domain-containing protein n=1 Tax=Halomarinibacterium sedimenti TaxID=2857106 RepID=A0A9X1JY31_9FLAO|nr:carboxypeptidase-like regulatory domain-containing protein [Halomarinibacterium sedimenti]MBW2937127.1 carboxypeptidase-like regulatory domain-containing protein [Halomarinibacterium sedimenti]
MKQFILTFFLGTVGVFSMLAQDATVKGKVVDANSNEAVPGVEIRILSSVFNTETDSEGSFSITSNNLPQGEQVLIVNKADYILQRIPITIQNGKTVDLDLILLQLDLSEVEAQIGIISLSDNELNEDEGTSYNVSGLLQATNDTFLDAAAFDFSATFFRPRGLDSEHGKVLINGIEMNKQFNGRPQWSNWGGLNDAQRNREFSMGLKANDYTFGGLAGTTNIVMRASQYRKGGRVSYAAANRSYTGRIMGSYNSGMTQNGWAYAVLASRRFGEEGFQDGTLYDANSFFASVEKKLNDDHSLNLTAFYTPNRRGRSTAITQEAKDLKGIKYNPNWGYQDGEIRNSRERDIEEPVIMLNHYWNISDKTRLNTNIAYQFGKIGNSRIDNGDNRNPFGNYYQRMPSYFLRFPSPTSYDYQQAYLAEQEFINDGQIDWNNIYQTNLNSATGYSSYVLQDDRVDDTQLTFNSIISSAITENITLNGTLNYRSLKSENFAEITDLLGGTGFEDFDRFYSGPTPSFAQSDVQNPNRIAQVGDAYKYNYELGATVLSGFAQAQFKYSEVDFYLGLNASNTSYQRTGIFQNGYFAEGNRSLGDSEEVTFTNFGAKGGLTYKVTGRHLIDFNGGYYTNAPTLRNTFANARQNNDIVDNLTEEKIQSADLSYIYRSPIVKARVTGFYAGFQDATEIGFFFTQNAFGTEDNSAFVQEIVQGIEKRNVGVEMGIEAQVTPTFLVKAAASVGQNIYTDNATIYLSGDDYDFDPNDGFVEGNDLEARGKRTVYLENYHVAGGPERAYQIGFEYRDPDFWWVGATTNYFSNAYVDVSSLRRSEDFALDTDLQVFADYDPEVANQLLQQEQLDDYFLVNIVGGKSWKIKDYYVGFFATINNVLDQEYKTGGFEDSRRSNYQQQLEEQSNTGGPLFGNRYFFGNGTTYYLNLYVRF